MSTKNWDNFSWCIWRRKLIGRLISDTLIDRGKKTEYWMYVLTFSIISVKNPTNFSNCGQEFLVYNIFWSTHRFFEFSDRLQWFSTTITTSVERGEKTAPENNLPVNAIMCNKKTEGVLISSKVLISQIGNFVMHFEYWNAISWHFFAVSWSSQWIPTVTLSRQHLVLGFCAVAAFALQHKSIRWSSLVNWSFQATNH